MKVALAFFGLPRSTAETFASIEDQLIAPLSACSELGVFFHFWQQDRVRNPRSGEDHALGEENYAPFRRFHGLVESPAGRIDAAQFESLAAYGDAWGDGLQSLRNLLLQLQSLQAAAALAARMDPDVVVFARPDLLYHDALCAEDVARAAARPREVAVPAWQWWGGCNDRFALCGRDTWRPYAHRLDLAGAFCKALQRPLHAERLLWFALYAHGFDVRPLELRASRVRAGGRMQEERFDRVPQGLVDASSLET